MSVLFLTVREDDTRGAKHGQSRWQYDHWKAKDATKGARKRKYRSILHRWQEEEAYRESQTARGWTEEHCIYLQLVAYHTTQQGKSNQDMKTCLCLNSMMACIQERCRIEMIFHQSSRTTRRKEKSPHPEGKRERHRPFGEILRSELEWQSGNCGKMVNAVSLIHQSLLREPCTLVVFIQHIAYRQ